MQDGAGPRPYDVSVSYLIELDPLGWLDWIELPADGPVESIESDIGTVLAEVDKALLIQGPEPWVAHIEIQANRDPRLPSRLWQYHALLHHRRDQIRVETTVVLLRPEADGPELSGRYEPYGEHAARKVIFEYKVIKLWERPVESLLQGGIGVLPLAPLASIGEEQLADVVLQLEDRVRREADATTASELRNVLLLLLNLRYDEDEVRAMIRGLPELRDTPVYRVIVEEGREEGRLEQARQNLLELGAAKFGPSDAEVAATVDSIDDLATLQGLLRGVLTAGTWNELLGDLDGASSPQS